MGRFRSKLKGQTKGKRWPKGQSSSSNPETRKFRNQAKNRFFQPFPAAKGSSTLTNAALDKHNAINLLLNTANNEPLQKGNTKATPTENYDDESEISYDPTVATTRKTFASEWSDCTNISFGRFLKTCHMDLALHKQMLAVLAAITEVIKQNGGSETSTEYYCSLLTTLETVYNGEARTDEQITAILALLKMGVRSVPDAVLRRTFDDVTQQMLHILKDYSTSDNNIIIRSALGILTTLLYKQELALWIAHDNTQQIYCTILKSFAIHTKPKWRKAAQQAIATIIKSPCFTNVTSNIAAIKCAEYCEDMLNTSMTNRIGKAGAGQTTILHILGLMKITIYSFPEARIKKCCELILRLITLNYPIVTTCGLEVLHSLFEKKSLSQQQQQHQQCSTDISADLNAKLIAALYEYQPKNTDIQQILAWLIVMSAAHNNLTKTNNIKLTMNSLPKYFTNLSQLWLCGRDAVISRVTECFIDLFKITIATICKNDEQLIAYNGKLQKCFAIIHSCLSYQYNTIWNQVLHVLAVMFDVCGAKCDFNDILQSLAELRDSYKFNFNNELEYAIGAAIRSMGVERVLKIVRLKKDNGDLNMDRSWLLPVLKENIKNSTLKYFHEEILSLARSCYQKSMDLAQANDGIGSHSNELLYLQLWNLLPCFCTNPIDIKMEFKNLAKVLGTAVSERKELRLSVMASLRKLIQSATQAKKPDSNQDGDASDLSELTRFAKNYLPIFFNVYTSKPIGTDEEGVRLAIYETIKLYLTITDQELHQNLFENAIERLNATSDEPDDYFIKESILDLIRLLIRYQRAEQIKLIYDQTVRGVARIKNHREQKRSYRILEEILLSAVSTDSIGCKQFISLYNKTIKQILMNGMKTSAPSSHATRLRCINYIIKSPEVKLKNNLIKMTFCEALLCCKDINERCRQAAFQLIKSIGELYMERNKIDKFLLLLLTGLIGTQQMMCGTVLAFASIIHYFNDSLGGENIKQILNNVVILASCSSREIVATCLSFIKVYCTTMSNLIVQASMENIMKVFTGMTLDCKRHFRLKTRDILDRLIRKYGVESIMQFIPADDEVMNKRVKNLRKLNDRKKKYRKEQHQNKATGGGGGDVVDDSDDDGEELGASQEYTVKSKSKTIEEILAECDIDDKNYELADDNEDERKKVKKKTTKMWIEENPDEIIDFMNPSATRSKITATKPLPLKTKSTTAAAAAAASKKIKNGGYATTSDGKLIIKIDTDDDDESVRRGRGDGSSKKKKKSDIIKINLKSDTDSNSDNDNDNEHMEITKLLKAKNRKRKRPLSIKSGVTNRSVRTNRSSGEKLSLSPSKYRTGGTGIHRKIVKRSVKT